VSALVEVLTLAAIVTFSPSEALGRSQTGRAGTDELTKRAQVAITQHRFGDAERLLRRAREVRPDDDDIKRLEAWTLAKLGREAEAESILDDVLGRHPRDEFSWQLRGNLAFETGDLDKAEQCYATLSTMSGSEKVKEDLHLVEQRRRMLSTFRKVAGRVDLLLWAGLGLSAGLTAVALLLGRQALRRHDVPALPAS